MILNTIQPKQYAIPPGIESGLPMTDCGEALGIIAKSVDPLGLCEAPGRAFEAIPDHNAEAGKAILFRKARWELKSAVEKLLPKSRTAKCCRFQLSGRRNQEGDWISASHDVNVYQSIEDGATFFGGLETCSSVWCCPICAVKISERRREELGMMQDLWKLRGGSLYMMTLTFPHGSHNMLLYLLSKFSTARKYFFGRKTWRRWINEIGLCHWIYCLEVTHGENGWHIHLHALLLVTPRSNTREPKAEDLLGAWQSACVSAGLGKPNEHGLDIRDGMEAAKYIGKWGIDLELTKQHTKKGREGNSTPFDLLRNYANGNSEAGSFFKEFAVAFKGKRQLVWSPGLRSALGMQSEKSDKQLAEERKEKAVCIALIDRSQWKLVLRYDVRAEILQEARYRGGQGVRDVLEFLETLWRKELSYEKQ